MAQSTRDIIDDMKDLFIRLDGDMQDVFMLWASAYQVLQDEQGGNLRD